eukprot:jgi/Galph1/604/GphlegSOOS_G5327.1
MEHSRDLFSSQEDSEDDNNNLMNFAAHVVADVSEVDSLLEEYIEGEGDSFEDDDEEELAATYGPVGGTLTALHRVSSGHMTPEIEYAREHNDMSAPQSSELEGEQSFDYFSEQEQSEEEYVSDADSYISGDEDEEDEEEDEEEDDTDGNEEDEEEFEALRAMEDLNSEHSFGRDDEDEFEGIRAPFRFRTARVFFRGPSNRTAWIHAEMPLANVLEGTSGAEGFEIQRFIESVLPAAEGAERSLGSHNIAIAPTFTSNDGIFISAGTRPPRGNLTRRRWGRPLLPSDYSGLQLGRSHEFPSVSSHSQEVSELLNWNNRCRISALHSTGFSEETLHPLLSLEQVENDLMDQDAEWARSENLSALERFEILSSRSVTGEDGPVSALNNVFSDDRGTLRLDTILNNPALCTCGYGSSIYPRRIISDPVNFFGLSPSSRKETSNGERKIGSIIRSRWVTSSFGSAISEELPDLDVPPVALTKSFCNTAFSMLRALFRMREAENAREERKAASVAPDGERTEFRDSEEAMENFPETSNVESEEPLNTSEMSTSQVSLLDTNQTDNMQVNVTRDMATDVSQEEPRDVSSISNTVREDERTESRSTPQLPGGLTADAPANQDPAIVEAAIRNTGIDPTFLAALPEDDRSEILASHIAQLATRNSDSGSQSIDENVSALNEEFLAALPPEIRREVVEQEAEYRRRRERELQTEENVEANSSGGDLDNASFLATLSPGLRKKYFSLRMKLFYQRCHLQRLISLEEFTSVGESDAGNTSNISRYRSQRGSLLVSLAKGDRDVVDKREGSPLFPETAIYPLVNVFLKATPEMRNKLSHIISSACSHRNIRQKLVNVLLYFVSPSLVEGFESAEEIFGRLSPDVRKQLHSNPLHCVRVVLELLIGIVSRDDRLAACILACPKNGSSVPLFVSVIKLLMNPFYFENTAVVESRTSELLESDTSEESGGSSSNNSHQEAANSGGGEVDNNESSVDSISNYLSSLDFTLDRSCMTRLTSLFPPDNFSEKLFHRVHVIIEVLCKWSQSNQLIALETLAATACQLGREVTVRLRQVVNSIECRVKESIKIEDVLEDFATLEAQKKYSCLVRQLKNTESMMSKTVEKSKTGLVRDLKPLWDALSDFLKFLEGSFSSDEKKVSKAAMKQQQTDLLEVVKTLRENRSGRHNLQPSLARIWPVVEAFLIAHEEVKDDRTDSSASGDAPDIRKRSLEELELMKFLEQHQESFNSILRTKPLLLEKSFRAALQFPQFIDFDNKKSYFRSLIRKKHPSSRSSIRIHVRREQVFEDSYHQLRLRSPEEMRGQLHVQFVGEEGIDAGGITREWYIILARKIFDPNYALFIKSAGKSSTFQPNPLSYVNEDHLGFFKFVGRIIGKAIYDGQILDAYFTRSFYKHMLGIKPSYHDLEALDPDYYKSLQWILENDITSLLDLTMSAEIDEFGTTKVVDLVPNGRNIPVTEENKVEYVKLVTDLRMTRSIQHQINAFLEGFHELISQEDIRVFNELELELLMSGLPDIDIADLKANVEYSGYTASSPQIQWFWQMVSEMSKEDHARLIMFITGTSKVPLEGFGALQGMDGPQRLQIHRVPGDSLRLPSSHTCFNHLDLPEYDCYEKLKERVLTAIREGGEGFGFG